MTEKECIDFINYLEKTYEVDKWTIDGVHAWPLIRLGIGDSLVNAGVDCSHGNSNGNFLLKSIIIAKRLITEIKDFLQIYLRDYSNNAQYDDEQILCLIHNAGRNLKIKEKGWIHQAVSPIYNGLVAANKKVFCLEYTYNDGKIVIPRGNKSKLINLGLIFELVKHKIIGGLCEKEYVPGIDEVIKECERKGISRGIFNVRNQIAKLLVIQQYYLNILHKSKIKMVIVSNWRNTIEMGLVMAAKKLGIKCIEIYHGYVGQQCYTHFKWIKEPKETYEVRPNYYWFWTKESALALNKELITGKAIYGGPPNALLWRNGISKQLENIDEHFAEKIPPGKKIVLFTLNPYITYDEYPVWLVETIKETRDKYFWLLRKHHVDKKDSGEDILCHMSEQFGNVEWKYSSSAPLFQLLEYADVHVTYNSSSIIEAESVGLNTIILSTDFKERFAEQTGKGIASYAYSKEDMIRLLETYSSANKGSILPDDGIMELIELLD